MIWSRLRDIVAPLRSGRIKAKSDKLKVVVSPLGVGPTDNPFQRLIYGTGSNAAFHLLQGGWIVDFSANIYHIHWYESLFHRRAYRILPRPFRLLILKAMALQLRAYCFKGGRIVWTAHNINPHEEDSDLMRHWQTDVAPLIDAIVIMKERHLKSLRDTGFYSRAEYTEIAHPHYRDVFVSEEPPAKTRASLGIPPGATVFGSIGRVRQYKKLNELIVDFEKVRRLDEFLLIAGVGADEVVTAQSSDFVVACDKHLSDEEVGKLHAVCDAVIVNYGNITNSGSIVAAISLGKNVIAPKSPDIIAIAEMSNFERFSLFNIDDLPSLRRSMNDATRKRTALDEMDNISPDKISGQYRSLFERLALGHV